MSGELTKEWTVRRAPGVLSRTIQGEEVVVLLPDLVSYVLNEVGRLVWSLSDGRSVQSIAAAVCARFQVPEEQAVADVLAFVEELATLKALVVTPPGGAPAGDTS